MTQHATTPPVPEQSWHHPGWRIVLCMFLVACGSWGFGFYGIGVYLVALHAHFGWPIADISALVTVYHVGGAGLLIFIGSLINRFGARPILTFGLLTLAAGVWSLSLITAFWQLLPAFFLLALGWACLSSAAITAVVAPWFMQRRGMAIGLALTGASVAGIAVIPAMVWTLDRLGFEQAMPALALGMVLVLVPTVWCLLRQPPPQRATGTNIEPPRAWLQILGSRRFWAVTAPFLLPLTAQVGFLTHQLALLEPRLGVQAGAYAVSVSTGAALIGRIVIGMLADRFDLRSVTAAIFLLQAACLVLLASNPDDPALLYLACAGYGVGIGNMITMPGLITHQEIDARDLPRAIGLVFGLGQVLYGFGPALLGWVQSFTGSYGPALLLAAAMIVSGAVMLIVMRPRGDAAH